MNCSESQLWSSLLQEELRMSRFHLNMRACKLLSVLKGSMGIGITFSFFFFFPIFKKTLIFKHISLDKLGKLNKIIVLSDSFHSTVINVAVCVY